MHILAIIEGWPYLKGPFFVLSNILNGDTIWTKVSSHYREGGRSSEVASNRGSTVDAKAMTLYMTILYNKLL